MSKLTSKARSALPSKDFAGPNRTYPDQDISHARNALARVANKSPALRARVDAAVHGKYPSLTHDGHKTPEHHLQRAAAAHGGKRHP